MRLRTVLAALTFVSVLLAPAATAKPPCPLMTDPAGDAEFGAKPAGDDPSLDFTSADITSDATRLTVVMRVVELGRRAAGSPVGVMYHYGFRVDGVAYVLGAKSSIVSGDEFWLSTQTRTDGGVAELYQSQRTAAKVDGLFDEDLSEIRMTVAMRDAPPGIRPGQRANGFRLISWFDAEKVGASSDFIVDTGRSYILGQRGCVKVGV